MYNKLYELLIEGLSGVSRAYLRAGREHSRAEKRLRGIPDSNLRNFVKGKQNNKIKDIIAIQQKANRKMGKLQPHVPQSEKRKAQRNPPTIGPDRSLDQWQT